jgi:PII-like signaling protein
MDDYTNEKTLLRIYINENDRYDDMPLSEALVYLFKSEGYPEATVLKCIAGFYEQRGGGDGDYWDDKKRFPVIVELIAGRGRVNLIMPRITRMMGSGMITMATVKVARRRTNVNRMEMHGYLQ